MIPETTEYCHHIANGNNDLGGPQVDDSTPITYVMYNENQHPRVHGCYTYNIGDIHFVVISSNHKDITAYDYYRSQGIASPTYNDFYNDQFEWIREDLEKPENKAKRWCIFMMHASPISCTRMRQQQPILDLVQEYHPHFVLCGHNHTYSRSIPIASNYPGDPNTSKYDGKGVKTADEESSMCGATISHAPDANNGVVYLMCQATGFKNSGKEGLQTVTNNASVNNNPNSPWWYAYTGSHPSQPSFITLDITPDKITSKAYRIDGILGKDANNITIVKDYGQQEIVEFDSVEIPYRPKGKK